MEKEVAVVILNWNGSKHLQTFLPSVVENSKSSTVYVIDNASSDNSIEVLQTEFPSVKIIHNEENGGFAKGYNDGLKHIQEEFLILLNSDVEVSPGWIDSVIQLMKSDSKIAIAQPKILSYLEKNKFEYAGAAGGYIDRLGYPFCSGRIFQEMEEDHGQYNTSKEVFWASGACMFIRNSVFQELGGFDERYFAHMEEIDLCWRAKNIGYKAYYCAESTVYHLGGGTLNNANPRKTFLNFRNSLITLKKNDQSGYTSLKVFIRLLLDGLAFVKILFESGPAHAFVILKAHFSFYGMQVRKSKVDSPNLSSIYKGIIVVDHFLRGKKKFSQLKKGFS